MLANMDDIRNIDESLPDIRGVREHKSESRRPSSHLDEIVVAEPEEKRKDNFLLAVSQEQKPLHKLYGSSRHLFAKQRGLDLTEETRFLLTVSKPPRMLVENVEINTTPEDSDLKIPKHDSQESVERIISERRRLDDSFKDVEQHNIYEVTNGSKENLVEKDVEGGTEKRDEKSSENG